MPLWQPDEGDSQPVGIVRFCRGATADEAWLLRRVHDAIVDRCYRHDIQHLNDCLIIRLMTPTACDTVSAVARRRPRLTLRISARRRSDTGGMAEAPCRILVVHDDARLILGLASQPQSCRVVKARISSWMHQMNVAVAAGRALAAQGHVHRS